MKTILLTNDDGIGAEGLAELARILSGAGELYVAAPDRPRSAASHSVTPDGLLAAEPFAFPAACAAAWRTSGTPADCVRLGVEALLPRKPDLVVSGINRGPNFGPDTLYSGTVAAAMEGRLYGIPSIACSLDGGDFGACRACLAELIAALAALPDAARYTWSLNLPSCPAEDYRGPAAALFSRPGPAPAFVPEGTDAAGRRLFRPVPAPPDAREPGTDANWTALGYCAVTPLTEFRESAEGLRSLRAALGRLRA